MKNKNRFITSFFFLFFIFNTSIAVEKTSFLNVDFLIQNSNIGKKVLKSIEGLNKKNIDLLEKRNKDLKKLEIEIKNKKNIISKDEFNNEVKNFKKLVKDFTDEKNTIVVEFNKFQKLQLEKLLKSFNPIITDYMRENSINIIIDSKNIFIGDKNSNITSDILKIVNDKIK